MPTDLTTAWGVLILEFVPVKVPYQLPVTVEDATNNNPIAGAQVQAVVQKLTRAQPIATAK